MLHDDRIWSVREIESAEELARLLTEATWCCCQAFSVQGYPQYVWVNDSTAPDRLQEYGILKWNCSDGKIMQIESITFSWCNFDQALQFIQRTLAGKDDNNSFACEVVSTLQTPLEHGKCQHCA